MNKDLRNAAVQAIANYMHYELFEITNTAEMLPWIKSQAESLVDGVDRAINSTKNHPLAKVVNKL